MLDFPCMARNTFRRAVLVGFAFLAIFPNPVVSAATLREEAITYRMQGYESQRRGDRVAALSLYQKAAELDPTYPTPRNDIGILLEEEGRLGDAERSYQQALALNPNYPDAHANLALLYERMGEKEKSLYHWMRRYYLGERSDPWTAQAEQRLVAAGVLKTDPKLQEAVDALRQSLGQFHVIEDRLHAVEDRLLEAGVITSGAGTEGARTSQQLFKHELQAHAQSLEEFHAATEKRGDWP